MPGELCTFLQLLPAENHEVIFTDEAPKTTISKPFNLTPTELYDERIYLNEKPINFFRNMSKRERRSLIKQSKR